MFLEKHPMIRFVRVKLIRSVAVIKGALTARKKQEAHTPAVNPWEADLMRLANERKNEVISVTTPKEHDEITQLVNDLAKAVKKEETALQQPADQKPKRAGDGTVHDLKSWWGDSLATWDPDVNGKNVHNDQRNKARQVKWFDKNPGFDK
ncbi:MAG: hypothetical protein EKK48_02065 [Candidatus Melainabacteria bacterium]|nr:MAG: hypothetical protein EKK48_02065 [Candidatus Melainabacteria bacterium]